jgi:hypothetical protein
MTTTTDLADVPHPAGAVHVAEWDGLEFDAPRRYFRGSSRVVERDGDIDEDITVEMYGSQGTDGDVTRHIMVCEGNRESLELSSSDHARQFGRALLAAADEWDQMATYDELTS